MATMASPELVPKSVPDLKFIDLVGLEHGASGFFKTVPDPDVPTPVIILNTNITGSTILKVPPELQVVVVESVGRGRSASWVKPRKVASVIPARRKLVKTMMYEAMVEFITSFFPRRPPKPNANSDADGDGEGEEDVMIDGN